MPFKTFLVMTLLLISSGLNVLAQTEEAPLSSAPPIAAFTGSSVILVHPDNTLTVIEDNISVTRVKWSPDGQHLAYVHYGESGYVLKVADVEGEIPITLSEEIAYFPMTFTPDGSKVIYAVEVPFDQVTQGANGPVYTLPLFAVNVDGSGEPTQIAEITDYGVGCGGGWQLDMELLYMEDAGFMGTGAILEYTPEGILHSTHCSGLGLALLDPETGEDTLLGAQFGNAVVSPDGTKALVILYNDSFQRIGINLIDLQTGEISNPMSELAGTPDQLAWGDEGTFYYSTRTQLPDPLPFPAGVTSIQTELTTLDSIPQYEVGLYRVNLETGETEELYTGNDWAVSRIFTTEDGVYFNVIPNVQAVLAGLADGSLPADTFVLSRSFVPPTLYYLPNDTYSVVSQGLTLASPQPVEN
jgi:hypothetical protein